MKIPLLQTDVPVPVMQPSGSNVALRAQYGLTGQVQNLIDTITEDERKFREKQKAIAQATEIATVEIDVEGQNQENIKNLRLKPNPDTYFTDWKSGFDNTSKNRLAQIKDPETKAKAQISLQRMQLQDMAQQKHYGNVLWIDSQITQKDRNADEYLRLGQEDKAYGVYDEMVQGGLIKSTEGAQRKEKANVTLGVNEIMVHPQSAEQIISDRKIPIEYQQHLRNVAEIQVNKLKIELDRQKTTKAHTALDSTFTVNGQKDFNAMTRELHNPKFQEQYGLTIEQVHSLDIDIRTEEADVRAAKQDKWNQTAIQNFQLEVDGKLTTDLLKKQVLNEDISPEMGRAGLSHLDGPPIKTDAKYYIDTLNKALEGKDVTREINWGIGEGKTLDTAHAAHLTQLQFEIKKQGKDHYASDEWFKLAKQEFADFFGTVEIAPDVLFKMKLAGQKIPTRDFEGYSEAVSTLMRSIEKNKLVGEPIWTKAQELKKFYSMRKAQGAETNVPHAVPDKFGFTIGEIRAKGNQSYQYIGENKWQMVQ